MSGSSATRILVVEDKPADRALLTEHLRGAGYEVEAAVDGVDAWSKLEARPDEFDVVLLDQMMPRMTGLSLLTKMKENDDLSMIPAIFQTAATDREDVLMGIAAGAYYYLTKPYDREMLLSIVSTAVRDHGHYKALQEQAKRGSRGLALLTKGHFSFRTVRQAEDLAALLASACPEPESAVIGLTELMVNAVEHGNLELTYDDKSRLTAEGGWEREVERRAALDEYRNRSVTVTCSRDDGSIEFHICDEGSGFDWKPFLEIDPRRAFDTHGRGIAMANLLSFDSLEYHGRGNEVTASIRCDKSAPTG